MTSLAFAGDVALSGNVERVYAARGCGGAVAGDVADILKGSELVIVNVECPLIDGSTPYWKSFPTMGAGAAAAALLKELGVGFGSLANNHIADYGRIGMEETKVALRKLNIAYAGACSNDGLASRPWVMQVGQTRAGILCLAQREISAAGRRKWGAGVLTDEKAVALVKGLAKVVDITVAYLHWGVEFFEYPTPHQVRLAHALVDAGAQFVIGHHPHVVQGYEWYKGAFVAYSLGNFIFDMIPSGSVNSRLGLVIRAQTEGKNIRRVEIVPVETANGHTRGLTEDERIIAEQKIRSLCSVVQDEDKLQENYYFTCRGNVEIHLRALRFFIRKPQRWCRVVYLLRGQFWPQIRELRMDLLRFLFSGRAIQYEKSVSRMSGSLSLRTWRAICMVFAALGGRWLQWR